jgi:hypothetical protein
MLHLINLIICSLILELVQMNLPKKVFIKNYSVEPVRKINKTNHISPLIRGQPKTRSGLITKQK